MRKVLVVGTGGLGSIVAFALSYTAKSYVAVVVRSDYEKVKNVGWEINSCDYGHIKGWKPDAIYPSIEEAAKNDKYDYVVVTTKNIPEVTKVEEIIEPVVTKGFTAIVLIQNGFDLGKPFLQKYPDNYCLSGVSYIGSSNHSGVINHTKDDDIIISYFNNKTFTKEQQREKCKEFVDLYKNDCNKARFEDDVKVCRYGKLLWNATYNTICALTRLDTGRLELSGTFEALAVPAMRELIKVARADGVEFPPDIINTTSHICGDLYYKPSMLLDVERGNPMELEIILGNVLKVSQELKVETPILNVLYHLLKGIQFKILEDCGLVEVPKVRPDLNKFYS
ncbi:hypothetical protein CANINC_001341 [Pichia inconspicua]|uniref:2-dehydropantoate 2-reductase n=1 Tax=Pichia inconspicua TaxID=52247 RepID=A0A4T0X460_9ASCO|nr:hypothetical protein CANINC_001341 [[Candida] inconspicua]